MARARRTSNPVTLFPFLAVLLCTIGALVLMLVVVSAGIRKDAVASATAKRRSEVGAVAAATVPKTEVIAAPDPLVELVAPIVDEPAARHRPIEPLQAADPLPSPIEEASPEMLADLDNLQQVARQLQAEVDVRSKRIQNMSAKTQALQHQLKMVKGQQNEMERAIIRTASQREELEKLTDELRVENQQVIEWLDESRKLIDENAKQLLSPMHSIVPYDGQTGTVRRPIIIECVGGVVRFEAEQVEISVDLLRKFSPDQNPLVAGVQALFGYWMAKEQQADPGRRPRKPYALILVRPSGAEAFSSVVFAMDQLIGDFGYELVETEFQYELPETTPDAVRECRAAVEAELRRGPVRSRRVLNPQGPVDISRVARGPAASRGFFGSSDFRNRRAGSSVAGDGTAASVGTVAGDGNAARPGGGPGVVGSPANRGSSQQKSDRQAASGLSEDLLKGLVAQGNSLLQQGQPSSFDSARAAALADAAQSDADGMRTGGPVTGESQAGSDPDRNGEAERERNSEKNGNGGGTPRNRTTGTPRWLADAGGRPAVGDGDGGKRPGAAEAGSGSGAGQSAGGGSGDGQKRAAGGDGKGRRGAPPAGGGAPPSENGAAPQSGQKPVPSGPTSPSGSQNSPSQSSTADPSNGGSSSGSEGSPVSGNAPMMRPPSRSNQVRSLKAQRRWGLRHPDASLGLEKVVVITVEAGRVVIGNQYQVTRRPELSTAQVMSRAILALDEVAKKWGWPPPRFYWVPSVRLEFAPSEQQLGMLLEKALEEAGAGLEE